MMNVLSVDTQIKVLKLLLEGGSVSGTSRLTGVHRDTCNRLTLRFASACRDFLNVEMRDLQLEHLELDELWTYCGKKKKNITGEEPDLANIGEFYLFIAMDEKTRLIPSYRLDRRSESATYEFLCDLFKRMKKPRPHLSDDHAFKVGGYQPITRISTDGFKSYLPLIHEVFSDYASYGQMKKTYVKNELFVGRRVYWGDVQPDQISTALVERHNATIRNTMKRLMRRTLGFSKKLENLQAMIGVYMVFYNYCWRVKTLKTTPAVAASIAPRAWTFVDLYHHLRERFPQHFLVADPREEVKQ